MSKIIITPLGTISPYTKGNMNCPGFLVEYNGKKLLLDCGNGITRLLNFPDDLRKHYRCAWCDDGEETRIPADAIECPGNCNECRVCWYLSKLDKDTKFKKH